ncbi:MAG: thioredoxin domain-containing protein [Bacteroidota bacterium]|nr:thioredoxin domain-containing protein [Bacteroidota bacterium]MDP3144159.1 thioredoxin domain-containing protein [Bacteroidota bacterium]
MNSNKNKTPNSLINESSPYLLQHAYNPVNWLPFTDAAFEKAKKENKIVLISIGYSACHWCHVMEHESFEDADVAKLMNEHFVNIKVDREERADVDMLYMQAVQLMTGQGGWPLNCFTLPDGKPIYGGTYFKKDKWKEILNGLANLYSENKEKAIEYAQNLTDGINQSELLSTQKQNDLIIDKALLKASVTKWKSGLDNENGGPNRAPKFPLPSNYQFLLRYAILNNDDELLKHVNLTLTKMAFGGIYDQLHGGFARYSTDMIWKVPHFEKMLYDNSQLVSLYCEAFTLTKNNLYKDVVIETLDFVKKYWLTEEGCFYSAFDADSDGEEGKYYVWNQLDLKDLLGDNYEIFSEYYEINDTGYWEHGNYILMRSENFAELLTKFDLSREQLNEKINACKDILKQEVKSRIMPGLDDKSITSWNALMCTAYAKAYLSLGNIEYKEICLSSINFILNKLSKPDGSLFRTYKNGQSKIDAFLDDYAFTIEALHQVYLITHDEDYLVKAKSLIELTLEHFKNDKSELLFYTNNSSSQLVARTTEVSDNVIPASNSQMALNLFYIGTYFGNNDWLNKAEKMLNCVSEELKGYGPGYSNWGCLALNFVFPFREIAIVGNNVDEKLLELYQTGVTNAILAVSATESALPLTTNRFNSQKTFIYVCENHACKQPVETIEEALLQLE